MELFQYMAPLNNLEVITKGPLDVNPRIRTPEQQLIQANWVTQLKPGTVYIEHCSWLNFTQFGLPKPIYINLIRDPVERVISWYYYIRGSYRNAIHFRKFPDKPIPSAKWFKKDFNVCVLSGDPECQFIPFQVNDSIGDFRRQTLFFCGNYHKCLPFNSPAVMQRAKRNVERDYAVVGSWEDTNITLKVFEAYIPRFFHRVQHIFQINSQSIKNRNRNYRKPFVHEQVKQMLRKNFTHEYEFYHFCKQRLYKQYLALRGDKHLNF